MPQHAGTIAEPSVASVPTGVEAVSHWCAILAVTPGDERATAGLAEALYGLGAPGPAAAIVTDLAERHRGRADLLRSIAKITEAARDWTTLIVLRRQLAALLPSDADVAASLGRALRDGGHVDEATSLLTDAAERFPHSAAVWTQRAHTALARGDMHGSRAGWVRVAELLPGNLNAATWLKKLDELIAEVEEGIMPSSRASRDSTPELVALLNDITSLGENCTIGFLQRFYGSEPVGMLRWARISTQHLLQAVRERFAGFGTLEQTRLDELNGRYFTVDTRFGIRSHTGVFTQHHVPENLMEREGRKHRKLRDLLLHQMQTGSKVFVHQATALSDEDIRSLTDAMRAIGPVTILFVRLAKQQDEIGRINELEEGVFVACIDRLGTDGSGGFDPSELWIQFCTTAHRSLVARAGSAVRDTERESQEEAA